MNSIYNNSKYFGEWFYTIEIKIKIINEQIQILKSIYVDLIYLIANLFQMSNI